MSIELSATDKAKFVKVLAETDQIRLAHTERHCAFFATQNGGKILELLGVGVHKSLHTEAALRGQDLGDFEYSVSSENLRQALGPFALSDTLSKIIRPITLGPNERPAEISPDDKMKFIRILAETDQIRFASTERNCYFFATETGAKMLELLGVGAHPSLHAQGALRGYDFGEFKYSVSSESLQQGIRRFALGDTLRDVIKPIPQTSRAMDGRTA